MGEVIRRWDAAGHYRARADELRMTAGQASDPITRRTLLSLADQYEAMAATHETEIPDRVSPVVIPF